MSDTVDDILRDYDSGLRGAYIDPREDELAVDAIVRHGGDPDGEHVANVWEFADKGKGKLIPTWRHVVKEWPGCWPGPPQGVGDCVSWAARNSALITWTCELIDGAPDEVTGNVEGKPYVSPQGVAAGVLSTEALYWWRGHSGRDGWTCSGAARAISNDSGIWLRQNYPDFRIDLTEYTTRNAIRWGSPSPPAEIRDAGRKNLVRTATFLKTTQEIRDFLWAGYGVFFCSMLKWSGTRDENGYSPVVPGSWAHAQAICAFDDRPEIVRIYGEPLACVLNSWGRWNRGPRRVFGTDLEIPEGAYWTKASTLVRGQCIALASVAGWPPRRLPDYGAKGNV
jgi:hypothetical protein